ncbi:hypothetical protein AK830_g6419 [Neonectria ditissima]|uniref:Transcription factor domain-containing protein n=1 Tax=Neonectria ditissima TaxID=78410 RepID=A0A0P7BIA0_9HYPO|nr:hypothetical protein AK830_g6419 [Neonectria ditissima]
MTGWGFQGKAGIQEYHGPCFPLIRVGHSEHHGSRAGNPGKGKLIHLHPESSSSASPPVLKGLETVTDGKYVAATEYFKPTAEDGESGTEDAEPTPTSSSSVDVGVDPGLSRVAAFDESRLDDFLDLLLGIPSYSHVAQTLRLESPTRQRTLSRASSRWSDPRNSLPAASQQRSGSPDSHQRLSDSSSAHLLPSFHRGLFPSEQPASLWARARPMPHPVPHLTQSTFDRLVQSYKRHSATIRPFLHFPTLDISLRVLSGEGAPGTLVHGRTCNRWKRQPHRSLLLSILALGAICDRKEALALELYHETRKEIIGWLAKLQKLGPEGAPPLELIQAFINYVCCGTKFGDKSIEDLTVGHSGSLRSLVQEIGLEQSASKLLVHPRSTCPSCSISASADWLDWVHYEERKRTFLTYFALMSSILTYLDTVTSVDWREVEHQVEALFSGASSGQSPMSSSTSPTTSTASTNANMLARISEPRNDYSCFILIAAVYRETWLQRMQNKVDFNATQTALQQWQTNWLRLAPQEESQPLSPLLTCNLAMFDNTQILLHLDIKEATEALAARDYGRFCVTLPAFDLRLDSEGSGCSLLSGREDWQQTYEIFLNVDRRVGFRHIALYSVNALELTFKVYSGSRSDRAKFSFTPHTGTAVFYCIQLLASWICFFSNCLNQELYSRCLDGPDSGEEREDTRLVQKVLAFARNRKIQFDAMFNVPSSPEMLDGLSAGRLASDLLDLHSQMFHNCGTWPAFNHLGNALKARSAIISDWLDPGQDGRFEDSP